MLPGALLGTLSCGGDETKPSWGCMQGMRESEYIALIPSDELKLVRKLITRIQR